MVKLDHILLLVVLFTFLVIDKPVFAVKKLSSSTTTVLPETNIDRDIKYGIISPMPAAILNAPPKGCPAGQRMDRGRCRNIIQ